MEQFQCPTCGSMLRSPGKQFAKMRCGSCQTVLMNPFHAPQKQQPVARDTFSCASCHNLVQSPGSQYEKVRCGACNQVHFNPFFAGKQTKVDEFSCPNCTARVASPGGQYPRLRCGQCQSVLMNPFFAGPEQQIPKNDDTRQREEFQRQQREEEERRQREEEERKQQEEAQRRQRKEDQRRKREEEERRQREDWERKQQEEARRRQREEDQRRKREEQERSQQQEEEERRQREEDQRRQREEEARRQQEEKKREGQYRGSSYLSNQVNEQELIQEKFKSIFNAEGVHEALKAIQEIEESDCAKYLTQDQLNILPLLKESFGADLQASKKRQPKQLSKNSTADEKEKVDKVVQCPKCSLKLHAPDGYPKFRCAGCSSVLVNPFYTKPAKHTATTRLPMRLKEKNKATSTQGDSKPQKAATFTRRKSNSQKFGVWAPAASPDKHSSDVESVVTLDGKGHIQCGKCDWKLSNTPGINGILTVNFPTTGETIEVDSQSQQTKVLQLNLEYTRLVVNARFNGELVVDVADGIYAVVNAHSNGNFTVRNIETKETAWEGEVDTFAPTSGSNRISKFVSVSSSSWGNPFTVVRIHGEEYRVQIADGVVEVVSPSKKKASLPTSAAVWFSHTENANLCVDFNGKVHPVSQRMIKLNDSSCIVSNTTGNLFLSLGLGNGVYLAIKQLL